MNAIELPVTPIAGQKQNPLRKLVLSNWVHPFLRNRIKFAPRSSHTNPLGNFEHFSAGEGAETVVALSDGSGEYALTELAGAHWLELAFAALATTRRDFAGWFNACGYELAVGPLDPLLGPREHPLLEVRHAGKTWLVAAVRGEPSVLVSDVGAGPESLQDLTPADQARVAAAAESGLCECMVCAKLRRAGGRKKK